MSVDVFLDDRQRAFRDEAAGLVAAFAARAEENDRLARFPAENFADLAEAGLLGLAVPTELGGRGGDYLAFSLVAEQIARGDASTCLCFTMHTAAVALALAGDDDQRRRILQRLAGGAVFTVVFAEPGSGAHFMQPETTATPVDGGYRLNGRKSFATSAGAADVVVVNAVVDGTPDDAFTLFMVEPKADPAIEVAGRWDAMGMRANDSRSLVFSDAFVPSADRLGGEGEGKAVVYGRPNFITLGLATASVGIAQAALDMAVEHATTRVIAPGTEPLASHQAIQFLVAEMAIATAAMRLMVTKAALTADRQPEGAGAAMTEAKAFCNEQGFAVANRGLQIVGGRGYVRGHQAERLVRDARAGDLMALTAQQCREAVGRGLLGLDQPPPLPEEPPAF
ncbi:MAG: acyl-CoA/acyl-ACP dehydrogenase [Actinobacteria bacterium]|nr:acyl-CoA/acyl-ACP dehydrogenase [Actinomycetota bacterium]